MPIRPKRPCYKPGCTNLVTGGGLCAQHAKAYEVKRGSARQRGYSSKWDIYSKAFLARHPYCADPFKRHTDQPVAATMTDHIVAHKGDMKLFWLKTNHQPLCSACNNYKNIKHEGGFNRESLVSY